MGLKTDKAAENNEIISPWYHCAVRTSIVCAVFSLIVLTCLIISYIRWRVIDANWETQSLSLKKEFGQNPDDEQLLAKIRELDLQFRQHRIRRLDFSRKGGYLLLGSITIMLIAIKSADTFKKKLPMPEAIASRNNEQLLQAKFSRWAVAAGSAIHGLGALILGVGVDIDFGGTKGVRTSYPSFEQVSQNWPSFRGPEGLGISAYTNIPDSWNGKSGQGILWKTKIPLEGNNSPVVWEDRIFLSGGNQNELKVFCFDAVSGELLWTVEIESPHLKNEEEPFEVMEDTGFAAPTTVTDGRRIYSIYVTGDIGAFDFNGKRIWTKSLGIPDSSYGYASSLAIYRNLVLIQFDQGGPDDGISRMIALDGLTSQTVWETKRPVPNSWASPIVTKIDEQFQLITCGDPWVIAYDPAKGTELWRVNCLYGDVAPSAIYTNGLIFVVWPDDKLIAIRSGGQGDITETHIVWENNEWGPNICSPVSNGELVFCYQAKDCLAVIRTQIEQSYMNMI